MTTPFAAPAPQIRIGSSPDRLTARIVPGDGATATLIALAGPRAHARFLLARSLAGVTYDALAKTHVNNMDEALLRPWVIAGSDVMRYLRAANLNVRIDAEAVERLEEQAARALAHYPRWYPNEDAWVFDQGGINPTLIKENIEILRSLGWLRYGGMAAQETDPGASKNNSLFAFAYDEVARIATKRDALVAWFVGAGKTRSAAAISEVWKVKHGLKTTIVLGLKRHLKTWFEELSQLEPLRAAYGQRFISNWLEKGDEPDFSAPYLILSLDRLKRLSGDEWARLLQIVPTSVVITDEIYVAKNASSLQAQALSKVTWRSAHNIGLSGTPYKGFPDDAHFVLSAIMRPGSVAFPDFRADRQGGKLAFDNRFVTFAISEDGARKRVPVLKNPDEFHRMLRPIMSRMLRSEPGVKRVLGATQLEINEHHVDFSATHLAYYEAVLERFTEWYSRQEGNGDKVLLNEVLVKLGYVVRACVQPWAVSKPRTEEEIAADEADNWVFPEYPRLPTAVHQWAIEKALDEYSAGNQVLLFGLHTEQLNLIAEHLAIAGGKALHGRISVDERNKLIDGFRRGVYPILACSYGTVAEGLNLGEASVVIILEPDWNPSRVDQAEGRITRGMLETTPRSYRVFTPGSIAEYQYAWAELKRGALGAGLDRVRHQVTGNDILDLQSYLHSVFIEGNPKLVAPRRFTLEDAPVTGEEES
jgi:hypothetical protein